MFDPAKTHFPPRRLLWTGEDLESGQYGSADAVSAQSD